MVTRRAGASSLVQPNLPQQVVTPEGQSIVRWVQAEINSLVERLNAVSEVRFKPLYVAPSAPRIGQLVYADGVHWDPGSGEGLYVYTSEGWIPLGSAATSAKLVNLTEELTTAMSEHNLLLRAILLQLELMTGEAIELNQVPERDALGWQN